MLDSITLKKPSLGSSIWSNFKLLLEEILEESRWLPGENSNLDFWRSNWLGESIVGSLNIPPQLAKRLKGKISDFWNHGWTLPEEFTTKYPVISREISNVILGPPDSDRFIWTLSMDGDVSSKYFFEAYAGDSSEKHWSRFLWKNYIPPKRAIHSWKVLQRRLPTDNNLAKRGFIMASRCHLCKKEVEIVDHVFIQCSFSRTLWVALSSWFSRNFDFL